jgi:GT2 family glycosyltransferase
MRVSPSVAANSLASRVAVVVVPRERFSHSKAALETLYQNTAQPFELIYVDVNSPRQVAGYLRQRAAERNFQLIRRERYVSPNQARNVGLAAVTSEFVLFIDNDCEVAPGCLSALLRCADETGAWAVAPVYFERDAAVRRVHMAGARVTIVEQGGVRDYVCEHFHLDCPVVELVPSLRRAETDLFEFHCVLLRRSAFDRLGPLDEQLLSALEQEDLALLIRAAGGTIYLEPEAQVTYALGDRIDRADAAYLRLRWSDDWNRRSVGHFRRKWKLKRGWGEDTVEWCNEHRRKLLSARRTPPVLVRQALQRLQRRLMNSRAVTLLRSAVRPAAQVERRRNRIRVHPGTPG